MLWMDVKIVFLRFDWVSMLNIMEFWCKFLIWTFGGRDFVAKHFFLVVDWVLIAFYGDLVAITLERFAMTSTMIVNFF